MGIKIDSALDNLQQLICHKTKPNQTKPNPMIKKQKQKQKQKKTPANPPPKKNRELAELWTLLFRRSQSKIE